MAVFRMNINAYPGSPNCYDSMADAFKQFGDLEKAKEFFEQAVKIAEKKEDSELSVYQTRLEKINIL